MDRYGGNLTRLVNYETNSSDWARYLKWTQDSASLFYVKGTTPPYEFRMIKADGLDDRLIQTETRSASVDNIKMSPDDSKFAYVVYPSDGTEQLVIVDMDGNRQERAIADYNYSFNFEWLISANGQADVIEIKDVNSSRNNRVSPDKKYVAFVDSRGTASRLNIVDAAGNIEFLYERTADRTTRECYGVIDEVKWSRDSKRVAFAEYESWGGADFRKKHPV